MLCEIERVKGGVHMLCERVTALVSELECEEIRTVLHVL